MSVCNEKLKPFLTQFEKARKKFAESEEREKQSSRFIRDWFEEDSRKNLIDAVQKGDVEGFKEELQFLTKLLGKPSWPVLLFTAYPSANNYDYPYGVAGTLAKVICLCYSSCDKSQKEEYLKSKSYNQHVELLQVLVDKGCYSKLVLLGLGPSHGGYRIPEEVWDKMNVPKARARL